MPIHPALAKESVREHVNNVLQGLQGILLSREAFSMPVNRRVAPVDLTDLHSMRDRLQIVKERVDELVRYQKRLDQQTVFAAELKRILAAMNF